jgi:hypothetical protein
MSAMASGHCVSGKGGQGEDVMAAESPFQLPVTGADTQVLCAVEEALNSPKFELYKWYKVITIKS